MRQHATVVPSDGLISVDDIPLHFPFPAPANLHALQWQNGAGVMEWTDDLPWQLTGDDAYTEEVAPYVALWEAEHARVDKQAADAEAQRLEQYNSPEARAERLRTERDRRVSATDYLCMPDYPLSAEARATWTAYRQALRDITAQPGFPWQGGGKEDAACPWPQPPAV